MAKTTSHSSHHVVTPHNRIKEKLDSSLSLGKVFDPRLLKEAESVIKHSRHDFLAKARADVRLMRECVTSLNTGEKAGTHIVHVMLDTAFEIKNLAGTYGFILATAVAISLQRFIEHMGKVSADDKKILKAHVDALSSILAHGIEGQGGKEGRELLKSLDVLIRKYKK
ncbi:MAG: hypothetical protein J0L97_07985 [Alphaproteobacteria bacterium]|nr:hypothetical protein [Alphaproteobacteria bacterium]